MAFTDRFIQVPIQAYSLKHEELYGEKEYFDSYEKFDPTDISSYFESVTDDVRCTQVYLKSGHSFLANCSVEKFEKLLNSTVYAT
jgi:hypothetical protein